METVHEIIRRAEENYTQGEVTLGEHVQWSLKDTVERIFAYLNSKHISGDTDSLGREKPFFNIVRAAVNIWYRATDIDRKDITILSNKASNVAAAFLANVLLQQWMKRAYYGVYLNQWGRTLAEYGSAVTKWVEKDGELIPTVIPWNRLIVDPVDFNALPRIEKFYKTPAQLRNMATPGHPDYAEYDLDAVESLITALQSRETLHGTKKDNRAEFVELYEVHGQLSLEVYKAAKGKKASDEDKKTFQQQMHVASYVQDKSGNKQDFTLYCGYEKEDPFDKDDLIEEDGRTLAIGAVESLFDSQWMTNHTMKQWKDQLDLSSKLVFQTADSRFTDRNVLEAIETGDILVHNPNMPLTLVPNSGHDITNLKAFADQWKVLSQEITSTPDAIKGNTLPSGTPYSLGAYLGGQANSLFEIMTENKGLSIDRHLRKRVVPSLGW